MDAIHLANSQDIQTPICLQLWVSGTWMSLRISLLLIVAQNRHYYVWLHDSIQQAAYNTLTPAERTSLYSRIGKAFLQAVKPENLNDLLYEVLALLNKGIDAESMLQRQSIANLNLSLL